MFLAFYLCTVLLVTPAQPHSVHLHVRFSAPYLIKFLPGLSLPSPPHTLDKALGCLSGFKVPCEPVQGGGAGLQEGAGLEMAMEGCIEGEGWCIEALADG